MTPMASLFFFSSPLRTTCDLSETETFSTNHPIFLQLPSIGIRENQLLGLSKNINVRSYIFSENKGRIYMSLQHKKYHFLGCVSYYVILQDMIHLIF